jgi:membrane protein
MSNQVRIEDLRRDLDALTNSGRPQIESAVRGRDAEHPGKIPARGWMDILWRCWQEVSDANLFLVAGGVTYAVLIALFPGLAALVAIYGLVLDPAQVEKQVSNPSGVLPDQSSN